LVTHVQNISQAPSFVGSFNFVDLGLCLQCLYHNPALVRTRRKYHNYIHNQRYQTSRNCNIANLNCRLLIPLLTSIFINNSNYYFNFYLITTSFI